jgi:hypothetical protein
MRSAGKTYFDVVFEFTKVTTTNWRDEGSNVQG